jgi:ABC-type multidrug transport system fused ATPase/permease subunit
MGLRDEPTVVLTRAMWRFSRGRRSRVVLYTSFFVFGNALSALTPLVIAALLNTVQLEGFANPWKLAGMALLIPGINALFWLFHGLARVMENENAFHVRMNFRQFLLEGVLALPASWHAQHHSGDTIDKINRSTEGLFNFSRNTFLVIEFFVRFITAFIALAYFNFASVYIVVAFSALGIWTIIAYDKKLIPEYRILNKENNVISAKVFDTISNITTITILKIQSLMGRKLREASKKPLSVYNKNIRRNEFKWGFASMVASTMVAAVLVAYIWKESVAGGVIMVGTLYALYGYADRISALFFRFAGLYNDIVIQKTALENVEEITKEFPKAVVRPQRSLGNWKQITVEKLSFSYHDVKDEVHMRDVTITVRHGERIAFVGESGSGKSTFLKLLKGIYEPRRAVVRIDSQEIASIADISDSIGLIPQDPELFQTTIFENITLGADINKKRVDAVVKLAVFDKTLKRLPNGYASMIHEKGVNLSGGEKQRLALARGLLAAADKQILLLDEPTSSVDASTERDIYTGILRSYKGRTIISTLHRLHLLKEFDTIYVFDKGRIVASGSFQSLKKDSPHFQKLWTKYTEKRGDNR